jgi:serine/threonine protein phosphatase PrpC
VQYQIRVTAFTDQGLVRSRNEDAVLVGPWLSQSKRGVLTTMLLPGEQPTVVAVADGIGGHTAGNLASWHALALVARGAAEWSDADAIRTGIREVNENLAALGETPELYGLGTTIAGIAFTPDTAYVFNVGDSRVYRLGSAEPEVLSVDDALVDDEGNPTNVITQALGDGQEPPEPHVRDLPIGSARYLLCSDGISSVIPREQLARAVGQADAASAAQSLIDAARENGATDNFSFLLVEVLAEDQRGTGLSG